MEPGKARTDFDGGNKASLYRSLSLHSRTLSEYAYQAECGDNVDPATLESHVFSIVQTMQLILDFEKMSVKKEASVQERVELLTSFGNSPDLINVFLYELAKNELYSEVKFLRSEVAITDVGPNKGIPKFREFR